MGRYTLFDDYLINGQATHFEVLKEIQNMGVDDDRVLVPALFHLASAGEDVAGGLKTRFDSFASLKQGCAVRMLELTHLVRKLRGHNYNIYECCFLAIGDLDKEANLLCRATLSLIAQILLLIILMYYNMSDITNVTSWNKDWGTILVVIITTAFFATKLVYVQWREASDFNAVFLRAGFQSRLGVSKLKRRLRKVMLYINIFVNCGLGIVVVLFNIFFLLISEDVNEAVLNSLAIFFILEMDDVLKPDWDEMYFDSRIALNVFRYIISGGQTTGVRVDIESSDFPPHDFLGFYMHLLESDDKVHFEAREEGDQLAINVYDKTRRSHSTQQVKFTFCLSGENGRNLFNIIKEFHCVKSDELAASNIDWDDLIVERYAIGAAARLQGQSVVSGRDKPGHNRCFCFLAGLAGRFIKRTSPDQLVAPNINRCDLTNDVEELEV